MENEKSNLQRLSIFIYFQSDFLLQKRRFIFSKFDQKVKMDQSTLTARLESVGNSRVTRDLSSLPPTASLQEKLLEARQLNKKLEILYQSQKSNAHIKTLTHSNKNSMMDNKELLQMKKNGEKLHTQVQHLKHLQNNLLCENKNLVNEVNIRRKERVIYSNVFKMFQKDIKFWEEAYKECLIQNLATKSATEKIRDRIEKYRKKQCQQLVKLQAQRQQKIARAKVEEAQKQIEIENDILNDQHRISKREEKLKQMAVQKCQQELQNELEEKYKKESRAVLLQNIEGQLLRITGKEELRESIQVMRNIDFERDSLQGKYEEMEGEIAKNDQLLSAAKKELNLEKGYSKSLVATEKSIASPSDCQSISQQILQEEIEVERLENELSKKADVNCRGVKTNELKVFLQRYISVNGKKSFRTQISNEESNDISEEIQGSVQKHSKKALCSSPGKMGLEKKLKELENHKSTNDYLLSYDEINMSLMKDEQN